MAIFYESNRSQFFEQLRMRCIQLGSSVGCSRVPQVHFVRKQTMCKSLYTYLAICFAFEKPRWLLHNTADRAETVFSHLNLPQHSTSHHSQSRGMAIPLDELCSHMAICGFSLFNGGTESRKNVEQRFVFRTGCLNPHGINGRFSFHLFMFTFFTLFLYLLLRLRQQVSTNNVGQSSPLEANTTHNFSIRSRQ